ncbi:alkaline phosphatase PhoX [Spongisporangium articulatum]|uniref:Alkaline phosphatase PhoX n=1 Tax=Spongisporangium articulatum TaxID=3362603 RepID=A0ABW8AW90_9ACTN
MPISRRNLLTAGASGVGLAVAGSTPSLAYASPADAGRGGAARPAGRPFPPLVDDPQGILALPPEFDYQVVTYAGRTSLRTGEPTPSNHDGTAVFPGGRGGLRLIQNHELGAGALLGVPHVAGTVYDPGAVAGGGCTVIETDRRGRNLGEWVGISGTAVNCAGGPTPWGTWLTCEETELKAGATWSANGKTGTYTKDHGYVFEVFADGRSNPKPIKAFGRYAHEALAVDADRGQVYLSEDASKPNGLFYRWTAPRGVRLRAGLADLLGPTDGTLEAMAIVMDDGSVLPDVAYLTSAQLGRPFPVRWVAVPERDGQTTSVRKQFTTEITRGKKFEGVWGTDKGVYVVNSFAFNTDDLPADAVKHDGMVWFYSYAEKTITLVTYFPHQTTAETGASPRYDGVVFDGPDNVTVTPWGTLVLAEDGVGASHVLSTTPGGPTYAIARNQLNIGTDAAPEYSEFTGPTFSADGKVLFVNIQTPGITLAITGPWSKYLG